MKRTSRILSRPQWIVDDAATVRNGGRQIDWSLIPDYYRTGSYQITVSADTAANATTLPVAAIPYALGVGTIVYLGGSKKFARLTAPALKGATSLTVEALPTAVVTGDAAWIPGTGSKHILSGTVMCELSGGKVVPRVVRPGSETAVYLIETDADDDSPVAALSGYGMLTGASVNENLLPEATGSPKVINSTHKTELGSWFKFQQYADSRT